MIVREAERERPKRDTAQGGGDGGGVPVLLCVNPDYSAEE